MGESDTTESYHTIYSKLKHFLSRFQALLPATTDGSGTIFLI